MPNIAYFTLDARGCIVETNPAAAELLGAGGDALRDRELTQFVEPASRPRFDALWERVCSTETVQTCELRLTTSDSKPIDVLIEAFPAFGSDPADRRVRIAALDIMSRKMVLMALQEVYGSFEHLVRERAKHIAAGSLPSGPAVGQSGARGLGEGVIATDARGCVTYLNPAAERYTGWNNMDAGGMPASRVFVVEDAATRRRIDDPVQACLREDRIVVLHPGLELDPRVGGRCAITGSVAPMHDAAGQAIGATLTFREVTDSGVQGVGPAARSPA